MCYVNNNSSHYELEKTSSKVEFSAYSDDYKNGMILGREINGNYYCKSKFDSKWEAINLATKDDLPNLFAPSPFPKENVGSNHYQAIQNIWNKLPHAQPFICTVQNDNQFVIVGYIYGNYKYGAVLYLAFNSCGIVKCNAGNFSDTKL